MPAAPDVAYSRVDSPLGPLLAAATPRGLVMLAYDDEPVDARIARLAAEISPRVEESVAQLNPVRREIEEYFEGRRRSFNVPVDWALVRGFAREVLLRTADIPYGEVRSYAEVAHDAGSPRGWRAVGNALGGNPLPIVVPCHRVIASDGGIGGYGGGLDRKRFLLALEGGARS